MNKTIVVVALLAIGCSASAQLGGALSKVKKSISTNASSSGSQSETSSQDESTASSSSSQSVTKLDDMGITNAVHQKYVNRMVWSSEKISFTEPDESKFKTLFNSGEHVYGRFYLSESLQNYLLKVNGNEASTVRYFSKVYIDGVLQNSQFEFIELTGDKVKTTTMQIWVHILPKDKDDISSNKSWVKMANNMAPGEHTVKFDLCVDNCEGVVTSGSFKYIKGSERLKYGLSFKDFTQGMTDATLTAEVLKAIQGHATRSGWDEKFTKAKISSSDWMTVRNELTGTITGRTLYAYCQATWPDGHCTVQPFTFKQDYNGSTYSKAINVVDVGEQKDVDCD